MEIQHFSHKHPLILDVETDSNSACEGCRRYFSGTPAYCCTIENCNFKIHKSCTELQLAMEHPFHPQHSLTLVFKTDGVDYIRCHACGLSPSGGLFYSCSDCTFQLDVNCASLTPTEDHQSHSHHIQHFGRSHPMILCDTNKNMSVLCSACFLPIEDCLVYLCLECKITVHKSCAELPVEIRHPFHPQHRLILFVPPLGLFNSFCCRACGDGISGIAYKCKKNMVGECFEMCVSCVSQMPIVKSTKHIHPLAFINVKKNSSKCSICYKDNARPTLRCVICDYTVHLYCSAMLPRTIKIDSHRHHLTYTKSPIRDYSDEEDDAEFYCDACEETRNLSESTYYCEQQTCHFVAHADCSEVISEVVRTLKEESVVTWKPEDFVKLAQFVFDLKIMTIEEQIKYDRREVKDKKAELELMIIKSRELEKKGLESDFGDTTNSSLEGLTLEG